MSHEFILLKHAKSEIHNESSGNTPSDLKSPVLTVFGARQHGLVGPRFGVIGAASFDVDFETCAVCRMLGDQAGCQRVCGGFAASEHQDPHSSSGEARGQGEPGGETKQGDARALGRGARAALRAGSGGAGGEA